MTNLGLNIMSEINMISIIIRYVRHAIHTLQNSVSHRSNKWTQANNNSRKNNKKKNVMHLTIFLSRNL